MKADQRDRRERIKLESIVTKPEPVTLIFEGVEYHCMEISAYSDRCLYFTDPNLFKKGPDSMFLFLDYRLEQLKHGYFRFSGYVEMEEAHPCEGLYRYVEGEFITTLESSRP